MPSFFSFSSSIYFVICIVAKTQECILMKCHFTQCRRTALMCATCRFFRDKYSLAAVSVLPKKSLGTILLINFYLSHPIFKVSFAKSFLRIGFTCSLMNKIILASLMDSLVILNIYLFSLIIESRMV